MLQITNNEVLVRLACAILCGAIVGLEREHKEKAAGLRTHVFVSMGSALIMIVSAFGFADATKIGLVVLDPSRIAAQVVTGIGFLGAGVIWFNKNKVRGLDTAAGIWATSAVGLTAGAGMYLPAFAVTLVVLSMNVLLKPIEQKLFPRRKTGRLLITAAVLQDLDLEQIRQFIEEVGLTVQSARSNTSTEGGTLGIDFSGSKNIDWLTLLAQLRSMSGVSSVYLNESEVGGD